MTTSAMRKQLIAYVADADDKKIRGLYSLLEESLQERNPSHLTAEQLAFLNEERRKHFNGESNSYSWEEIKEVIRRKRASKVSAEDWKQLTREQQQQIETGIRQANAGDTKPVEEVIARLRKKHGLNG